MPADAPSDSNRLSGAQALLPEVLTAIARYVRQFDSHDRTAVEQLNRDVCNASFVCRSWRGVFQRQLVAQVNLFKCKQANALLASSLIERYPTQVLSIEFLDDVDRVKVIGGLRFVTELHLGYSKSEAFTFDQSVLQTFQDLQRLDLSKGSFYVRFGADMTTPVVLPSLRTLSLNSAASTVFSMTRLLVMPALDNLRIRYPPDCDYVILFDLLAAYGSRLRSLHLDLCEEDVHGPAFAYMIQLAHDFPRLCPSLRTTTLRVSCPRHAGMCSDSFYKNAIANISSASTQMQITEMSIWLEESYALAIDICLAELVSALDKFPYLQVLAIDGDWDGELIRYGDEEDGDEEPTWRRTELSMACKGRSIDLKLSERLLSY